MVYIHTLTFVTVFIWRDLFFGYKLVTNWLQTGYTKPVYGYIHNG